MSFLGGRPAERASVRFETVVTGGWIGIADREDADAYMSVEARASLHWHGIRPWLGVFVVDSGTWFSGAGFVYDFEPVERWVVTLGSGPFYYEGEGRDLGLNLEFYSFFEVTHRLRKEARVGARIGHLSNAGLGRRNPGTETFAFVAVFPIGRGRG